MEKGTILVVDDDPTITEMVQTALELEGYTVYCAVDGAAVQPADDVHPDTILLDIMMPGMDGMDGMDGVEVSKRLRADPTTADIPIVVMSAQDCLQATSGKMAVDDRLSKPFDILTLYATVDRWVETGV